MAIRTVVTSGFGNGTFTGTIALLALRGYLSVVISIPVVAFVAADPDHTVVLAADMVTTFIPVERLTALIPAERLTNRIRRPKT